MEKQSQDPSFLVGEPLVGLSRWVVQTRADIAAFAPFDSNVLITGPNGTGKELIARAFHNESKRRQGPFIAVNCAAITGTLFESHLFGHERGAFTGADYAALGCFRAAEGGTVFLDEIGELEPAFQAKLLRVLQEGTVVPVGSHQDVPIDVRVIAATNRNPGEEIAAGRFRQDLYYRLAVVTLQTLPLCARSEDIELLADYLLAKQCVKHGLPFKPLSFSALEKLQRHSWPGNVRELQNVLERAVMVSRGPQIVDNDIHLIVLDLESQASTAELSSRTDSEAEPIAETLATDNEWPSLEEVERLHIERTLQHTCFNQSAAAKLLQLDRSVLRRRLRKLGIDTVGAKTSNCSPG